MHERILRDSKAHGLQRVQAANKPDKTNIPGFVLCNPPVFCICCLQIPVFFTYSVVNCPHFFIQTIFLVSLLLFFLKNFVLFLLLRRLIFSFFSFPFFCLLGCSIFYLIRLYYLTFWNKDSQQCSLWAHPHFSKRKKRRPGRSGEKQAGFPYQGLAQQDHREDPPVIMVRHRIFYNRVQCWGIRKEQLTSPTSATLSSFEILPSHLSTCQFLDSTWKIETRIKSTK